MEFERQKINEVFSFLSEDAKKLFVTKGEIVFNNVSFEFNRDNMVLKDINITIKPGQKVAVIGPSGAGKTTLARLIMRIYNLTKG